MRADQALFQHMFPNTPNKFIKKEEPPVETTQVQVTPKRKHPAEYAVGVYKNLSEKNKDKKQRLQGIIDAWKTNREGAANQFQAFIEECSKQEGWIIAKADNVSWSNALGYVRGKLVEEGYLDSSYKVHSRPRIKSVSVPDSNSQTIKLSDEQLVQLADMVAEKLKK